MCINCIYFIQCINCIIKSSVLNILVPWSLCNKFGNPVALVVHPDALVLVWLAQ